MPNSIVHFEIPADDVQRAKTFYEKVLGWKISDPWNMNYFMVETKDQGQPGINGGLMPRKNAGQPFMNYIGVDSIDAYCQKVLSAGGIVVLPKTEIGQGMGWIAAFKDTEGNLMGFHEMGEMPAPQRAAGVATKKKATKKAAKKAAKKVVKTPAKKVTKKVAKKATKKAIKKAIKKVAAKKRR